MSGASVNLRNVLYYDESYGPMKFKFFWTRGDSTSKEFSDWLSTAMEKEYNIIDIIQCETAAYVYYQERKE